MATKSDLMDWVLEALVNLGGTGSVVDVSREIWQVHESDLRHSDVRWAAQKLRDSGRLRPATNGPGSGWAIA